MLSKIVENYAVEQMKKCLTWAEKFVILTHIRPDGDAMGSSLAWCQFLRQRGKKATVIIPNAYPSFLSWMPSIDDVVNYELRTEAANELLDEADVVCCLDFNTLKRLGVLGEKVASVSAKQMLIDHHPDADDDFYISVSSTLACSTSELVFRLICHLGSYSKMTKSIAECIYVGMMTDTGAFAYASNNKDIFYIVGELISKGIDKDAIYRKVFYSYSPERMKLMGFLIYEKLQYFPDRKTALITLENEELKRFNASKGDTEGFVNMPLQTKGYKLSCFLREEQPGKINVSLRSVGDFPCNAMAAKFFNGGGHVNASGGELLMTMELATKRFAEAIEAFKDKLG